MTSALGDILDSLSGAFARFADPSQRIFWPFLIASAAIALAVCAFRGRRLREVFSPSIWWHPSARMDYRLFFANAVIKGALWSAIMVSAVTVVFATSGALESAFGAAGDLGWASWQISLLYTVVLFVGLDASRFALHLLMHRIPALWQFHQVHHSAEVLTPLTVYRVHPVESFLYGMRGAICTGLITGVFWYVFRGAASQAELLGINAIGITLNALGANLRHSHVWLPYGKLEAIFMSPAQHQMHHGRDEDTALANYGAFLSLWDRLAGTFVPSSAAASQPNFGLDAGERNHEPASVTSAYVGPVVAVARSAADAAKPVVPKPATAMLAVSAMQCGGDTSEPGAPDAAADDFDRAALVANLAEGVIIPSYEAAIAKTSELGTAIDSYCAALGGKEEPTALDAARAAWLEAMTAWQRAELSIVGPASPDSLAMRDFIYSWPVTSACAVDQAVMEARENAGYDIEGQLLNRRGLDALEYLLHNESEDSQCAPQIRPEGWDALPSADKWAARCSFASIAAEDLEAQQQALLDAWVGDGGFLANLTSAGEASSDFASSHEAANALFAGLFYLDLMTKDAKMAAPLGRAENACDASEAACAASLEMRYAPASKPSIIANLSAFQELFEGGDGLGFDDFLVARDAAAISESMSTALAAAAEALGAIEGDLASALDSDIESVRAAHDALTVVTTILKTEVPPALQLDIPESAGGDAD